MKVNGKIHALSLYLQPTDYQALSTRGTKGGKLDCNLPPFVLP